MSADGTDRARVEVVGACYLFARDRRRAEDTAVRRAHEGVLMKTFWVVTVTLLLPIVIVGPLAARDLRDKVKVEVDNTVMEPGMAPGTYVCSGGHLHVKGTVENQADVPLRHVKVVGKAFDANGKLLGTATATTETEKLAPGEKTEIDVEFPTVTGAAVAHVKRRDLTVVEAPSL